MMEEETGAIYRIEGPKVILRRPEHTDEAEFIESSERSRGLHAGLVHPATTSSGFASFLSKSRPPMIR